MKRHQLNPAIPGSKDLRNGHSLARNDFASTKVSGVVIISVSQFIVLLAAAYIWGLSCAVFFDFGRLDAVRQQNPLIERASHLRIDQNRTNGENDMTQKDTSTQKPSSPPKNVPLAVSADDIVSCQSSLKECCEVSIRNAPEKIDIVIPYKYREATDVSLMYELRSFEKSGLLDHVGKVFIITNSREETKLLEERYHTYIGGGGKQLHIIAADEIKVPFKFPQWRNGGKNFDPLGIGLVKTHYAPYLPQLSSYYVLIPDDNVMLRNYTRDIWFDSKKNLPYAHSFGAGGTSMKTHGFASIAEMHGPNFLNRCSMQYVIQKYNVTHPKELSPTAVAIGTMKRENLLSGFYTCRSNEYSKVGPHKTKFFRECHTNNGCRSPNGFSEIFVNIQGNGISIEYQKGDEQAKKAFMSWFRKTFPSPSRFE